MIRGKLGKNEEKVEEGRRFHMPHYICPKMILQKVWVRLGCRAQALLVDVQCVIGSHNRST